ncbi:unnamed protein product, partial [Staurois parvus]
GTVQDTGGQCTQRGQFRTRVDTVGQCAQQGQFRTLTRQAAADRNDERSAFQGQPVISRQQQLPGHSTADGFQGQAATDSVQGPSAAAPRTFSSRQSPGTRSHGQCSGSLSSSSQGTQQRRLMQSCGD